ncbi:MAG: nickel pincer cofactor biosynthesis protein LarC [Phycisphaerales bacterium]|nr:nickel pincer cofactor biosynthesis protein LarC [Phycisphaerales bacterium]
MRTAYFDCFCGAAGDMIVAALVDVGLPEESLAHFLKELGLAGYSVEFERVKRHGLAARRFVVTLDASQPQPHRHLHHVVKILETAPLPEPVRANAVRVFQRLAEAEAKVHATTVEKVHFHEVGAVDAIVDVVGACFALHQLGVERVTCSPIPTGLGTVRCAHGDMPVPAPATAELLRGVPLATADVAGELTTPTGAALLTTLASSFGPLPAMTLSAIGCGAGTKDFKERANVLRVLIGESAEPTGDDKIVVLETNLDDASPQVVAFAVERLWETGVLDVYTLPIQMKKGRTGVLLCVLCEPHRATEAERVIFSQTPTFGVRRTTAQRSTLTRRHETVATEFGPIRVKVGQRGDVQTAAPEYEDCREAAIRSNAPVQTVMDAARRAWELRSRR